MIREAIAGDEKKLQRYFRDNFATTMFMRGNLRDFGLGNTVAPLAMRYYIVIENNAVKGVVAITNTGTVMAEAQTALADLAAVMVKDLPENFVCHGLLGAPAQVALLRNFLNLANTETVINDIEPLFVLDLKNMFMPPRSGMIIRPANDADLPVLQDRLYAYGLETGLISDSKPNRAKSDLQARARIGSDRFQFLIKDNVPVAQTAFNAVMHDAVQIGGVYTPPALRQNGYGRLAVALHLEQARKNGVKSAVLFTTDEYAARAYRAIGFEKVGQYAILLFKAGR